MIAHVREQVRWRRVARQFPQEVGNSLCRLPLGETQGKQSVQPKHGGGCRQNGQQQHGLGADAGQKDRQITDRGKPQPIDEEIGCELKQEQANPDDEGRNDEPHHGVLPWCLPLGSSDPDRHGRMIAEMKDACRLIHAGDCVSKRTTTALSAASAHSQGGCELGQELCPIGASERRDDLCCRQALETYPPPEVEVLHCTPGQ
ncbi:hypothetical protein ACVWXO_003197 [Bradyrhizobium sp. LM2.7]